MRIGIDAGGTFTDFVVLKDDGQLHSFKLRSNRMDPAGVILAGIRQALQFGRPEEAEIIHGSTVATNALLERKGAKTAFVTTEGFEDILHIGRQNRTALYDLTPAPRRFLTDVRFGVKERTHADGSIELRPSPAEIESLKQAIQESKCESIAICFLHAYQTPENEQFVMRALAGLGYVSASHEICPEFREFERGSTTLINAYVGPLMDRYLGALERGSPCALFIMQSNGGLLRASEARRQAVRTVLSGPAGGVVGAFYMAKQCGFSRAMGFDMGGTSTDVSLCDGSPRETMEAFVDGFPIRVPMLDIHTVGAGGGSIARVDEGGLLRVGPESAGSDPGPACYGLGDLPTVTDAHVVLGRITADQFLGGALHLEVARSEIALQRLASQLGLTQEQAAAGVLRVANASMERAIRAVSLERGYDPRDFALVAFGGCGGLHACDIASELGIRTVIAPEQAGVLSALGMLLADRVRDYAAGVIGSHEMDKRFQELEATARKENPSASFQRFADLRYEGQSYELTLKWQGARTLAAFHREHQRTYGYADLTRAIEPVTIRVRAISRVPKPRLEPRLPATRPGKPERRRVYLDGGWRTIDTWRRSELPSRLIRGPALVLDYGSTVLIPEGWLARLGPWRNLILTSRKG
ncbi:MAG: hydantoinase/oxoprolinase family protein [Bryobacteraceae bacterium]|nr:hydantoinase/oxoprolinase family protein [Bryobacteraceae bacterium]MDW8380012.1 hydantoinase/oxoprolinase family protein [Bryobacterales bacterium]